MVGEVLGGGESVCEVEERVVERESNGFYHRRRRRSDACESGDEKMIFTKLIL
jgi:hypothetical protein